MPRSAFSMFGKTHALLRKVCSLGRRGTGNRLFAGGLDRQRLVLAVEQLGFGQRLWVAGSEAGDCSRDGADAIDAHDLDLRLASLHAVGTLQWNADSREAFVRPTAELVAHLRLDSRLCLRPRVPAAARKQQGKPQSPSARGHSPGT